MSGLLALILFAIPFLLTGWLVVASVVPWWLAAIIGYVVDLVLVWCFDVEEG